MSPTLKLFATIYIKLNLFGRLGNSQACTYFITFIQKIKRSIKFKKMMICTAKFITALGYILHIVLINTGIYIYELN